MAAFYDLSTAALIFLSVVALFFGQFETAKVLSVLSVSTALLYLGEPYIVVDERSVCDTKSDE